MKSSASSKDGSIRLGIAWSGEKQQERETEAWRKLTVAVAQVLEGA